MEQEAARETSDPRDDRTRRLSDPSVTDAPVYQEVNARHGTMLSVTELKDGASNMTQKEPFPNAIVTAMMFVSP
jgi:hypothetical protein